MRTENKKYFVEQIHSSKANKMTALYHYSGVGFKKAILNLGVFRKEDSKMVGVLQWGSSYQENIRLDRYVKETINKSEYLELNRFSMADSEGPNSESQAISLGIKWIKKYMPEIRLLVSYAGRKEGNYGYIYQATNWEYLGYFISEGFWFVDGVECHLATLWYRYKHHANQDLPFIEGICDMYQDVRKTWTKQFIYIMRLDNSLTTATPVLEYPKPTNEFPIKTREYIYKRNDKVFNSPILPNREHVDYYYEKETQFFTTATLRRRWNKEKGIEIPKNIMLPVACYDIGGTLEHTWKNMREFSLEGYRKEAVKEAINLNKSYKNKYFKHYEIEPEEQIDVPVICYVDEIPFNSLSELGRYLNVSRQAIHQAKSRKAKSINNKNIHWVEEI